MSRYIYNAVLIASVLIFCLPVAAEKQKATVSITDPECQFVYLVEEYDHFSDKQKLL